MNPIIGLMGKKRSGKDSFASTLTGERGFTRFAFADPLKEAALSVDPFVWIRPDGSPRRLSAIVKEVGWEKAKEIREVRRFLQNYGVAIRGIQEDFWVRATLDRAIEHADLTGPVVVTDVRFPNEADEVRASGGLLVRVVRPGQDESDQHASETALDDYQEDVRVYNGGTLEDLAEQARALPEHPFLTAL